MGLPNNEVNNQIVGIDWENRWEIIYKMIGSHNGPIASKILHFIHIRYVDADWFYWET